MTDEATALGLQTSTALTASTSSGSYTTLLADTTTKEATHGTRVTEENTAMAAWNTAGGPSYGTTYDAKVAAISARTTATSEWTTALGLSDAALLTKNTDQTAADNAAGAYTTA